jgi:D-alanyl-D-alanine endopeptidase (penicillin-binding protein 7)
MKNILTTIALAVLLTGVAHARGTGARAAKSHPVPEFSAKSYLIADSDGLILKEQEGGVVRPIASISKLMVALLASEQDLSEQLEIPKVRTVQSTIPKKIVSLSRKEMLTLALVHSDNFAAQILCINLPNCVDAMNQRAVDIGMVNTHYNEPTGLDKGNVSTAQDLLKLLLVASSNRTVAELSSMPNAEVETNGKVIKVRNTNPLTAKYTINLSKTGFTNPAGGCLVMIMQSPVGQRILILLGSRNAKTRIPDMERLVKDL